jgi:hypothetical protein
VLDSFEKELGRPLLKKDDRMLYAAKYLWYADMVSFRDLGRGMTGATYAALPMSPQLNNYRDLVDEIFRADPGTAHAFDTGRRVDHCRCRQDVSHQQDRIRRIPSRTDLAAAGHRGHHPLHPGQPADRNAELNLGVQPDFMHSRGQILPCHFVAT